MHQPLESELELEPEEMNPTGQYQSPLKPRSKKIVGAASGAAIGSAIPVLGPLLGALIGYTVADSQWVAKKVDNLLSK